MFKPITPKLDLPKMEEAVLKRWKENHIFEKTSQARRGRPEFVFYEGPPTANGLPGIHSVEARVFKDLFPRYKTMRGYHVVRRGGWDTHGLPVELEVEKRLGFTTKKQIEEYGIERFNALCRKSVFDYIQDHERLTERIAFWVDLQEAYVTFTNDYIESIWWILKTFWDRGLIYQGYKVVPYCPRCGTPLSDHEVAQGYAQAEDPSVFVRFPLVDDPSTSLLVWTTTPWTLPGNVAVAAHPEVDYVIVERDLPEGSASGKPPATEKLILAHSLLDQVFRGEPVRIFETFKGKKLKGLHYRPLFTFLLPDKPAYFVLNEEYVNTEDGTGLVHLAPAFGAEDMQSALEHDLPILVTVEEDGSFSSQVRPWRGKFVKDADPLIVEDLDRRGLLYRAEIYTHTYPFCWRCETPLLYYARGTWYLRTTQYKDRLVELNRQINWVPEHIREGRFGNWLENNIDWALGRERYWGTPLPVWECLDCHHQLAVGSVAELSALAGEDLSGLDLHRPYVDEVKFACPECKKGTMLRAPELIDGWFDSGAMPVAQWHYPFENREVFESQFPADFICEGIDQTRGWFYSLHAVSTLLFEKECYKNVICLGLILDAEGQKMSKSRGNMVDPWEVIKVDGADACRWYMYTTGSPWQARRFTVDLVNEVVRNFTLPLWNVYSFFVTYANLDGWKPSVGQWRSEASHGILSYTQLDRWLLSEVHTLVRNVTAALEAYDVPNATRPIQDFVDILSKWYLRRSRRRFWKSEADEDKNAAYASLYQALITLSKLLAPAMPFLADEIYTNLVGSVDGEAIESVHLATWPEANASLIDEGLNRDMELVMKLASLGHAARNEAGIKVRQPLAEAAFALPGAEQRGVLERYAGLLADELNVRQVRPLDSASEAIAYRLNPLPKQLGQKYKARLPAVRAAILALDPEPAAQRLLEGSSIEIAVDGDTVEILPGEVEVRTTARPGLAVAAEGAFLCALKTDLTPELVAEGLAREFVRRVQDLRKEAGFDIADRICLYASASPPLAQALAAHRDYITGETLAVEFKDSPPPEGIPAATSEFDGETVTLGVEKASM